MSATTTLAFPYPLLDHPVGGHVQYGRRYLSWGPLPEGEYYRNRWSMAWVEVSETEPWRGDRLWLTAQRRRPGAPGIERVSWTDKARSALQAEVVPLVARYGFDRLWTQARSTAESGAMSRRAAQEARVEAAWFEAKADLAEMAAAGMVEYRPVGGADRRPLTVRVVAEYRTPRRFWEHVAAEVLVGGERVGWVTRGGQLVPLDTMLREERP